MRFITPIPAVIVAMLTSIAKVMPNPTSIWNNVSPNRDANHATTANRISGSDFIAEPQSYPSGKSKPPDDQGISVMRLATEFLRHQRSSWIRGRMSALVTLTTASVTGRRKRRGPALPGLR